MPNRITIVDEQDNVIGALERDQLTYDHIFRAGGLWITNTKGQVLLAQRAFIKKTQPGKWGPAAAGTIDEGESYEENIIKETQEELGLTLTLEQLMPGPHEFINKTEAGERYFGRWFVATLDIDLTDLKLQVEEVAAVAWFDRDELEQEVAINPDKFTHSIPRALKLFS